VEGASIEDLVTTCHLGEVTASVRRHVFVAPFPCRVASARLVTAGAVPEAEDASWTITLERVRGEERSPIVAKTTVPETGEAIGPSVSWHFDVSDWDRAAAELKSNDVVVVGFEQVGPAPPLADVLVALRYEPR
jgi:hypothetical protein